MACKKITQLKQCTTAALNVYLVKQQEPISKHKIFSTEDKLNNYKF